jgi:hypothetical protein
MPFARPNGTRLSDVVCNAGYDHTERRREMDYKKCVLEIEEWANSNINCSHVLCSIDESVYEELYGGQVIAIINKHRATIGKSVSPCTHESVRSDGAGKIFCSDCGSEV